jgi:hypothetical protein
MLNVSFRIPPVLAMPAKRPPLKWLQLHVALAWVLTRDYAFTHEVERFANPNLANALALYNYEADEEVETVVESEATAWLRLREAIVKKLVRARGVPYDKDLLDQLARAKSCKDDSPVLSELEELELELDRLGELHRLEYGKAVAVPALEASTLVIEKGPRQIRLRPETSVFSEGPWWHDVIVSRDDLIMFFPVTQPTTSKAKGRAHLLTRTIEALIDIYGPNGPDGISEQRRLNAVKAWLFENARKQSKNPDDVKEGEIVVSNPTIRRALKVIRERLIGP